MNIKIKKNIQIWIIFKETKHKHVKHNSSMTDFTFCFGKLKWKLEITKANICLLH